MPPDLVDGGRQFVHLPLDVVGHALWKLGQILLVLKYRSHHLKHTEIIKKIGCCLGEPDPVYGTYTDIQDCTLET